ncbi:MAG TPA: Spo0B domain-containing protein [Clostridia bacterium]|nr:Spo0B domain-containing protein [Clostridia bacterium]
MKKNIEEFKTGVITKGRRDDGVGGDYDMLEAEKERSIESLKAHLSEQRHDFFNLLQVLYGYTQLKKPDKVLSHIKDYCTQMENIGRLYNCKCIKLADLLYTKDKEAGSIDLNLEVNVDVSFEPVVRMLDDEAVLHAVDHAVSIFLYVLDDKGLKNSHIQFDLREGADDFQMEIYCRELREGQLEPISFVIPLQEIYWKKIERSIVCMDRITKHCNDKGFDGRMLEDDSTFVLSIRKK